jgi:hypothetical protein
LVRIFSRFNINNRYIHVWPDRFEISLSTCWSFNVRCCYYHYSITAIKFSNRNTNIAAAVSVGAAVAAEGTSYKLSDISFTMVRYDLPKAVTDAMTSVLASNSVYQYWFPSYTSFMGQPVTGSKTGTTRISLSTSSLEMLIGTFMVQNRDTQVHTHNR